jgi:hypothetical protein
MTYLCNWGHGELQRQARHGLGELELIVLCELLLLLVGRAAVLGHKGIHLGSCGSSLEFRWV